ncbi:PDZ domain-containing protein [Motilibacter rhizosphaerae]|uniref:endopeptidase La n=1 Tax=Motilibacter rhizosphaerae TaxID=598652 RepID=A0A4Q7NPR1_9ACTN|nr:PDZ domain-containing protein [Motilibacter rhizosphaerae]RZS87173.1 PDZ domain-containing protein [Motilibacter rhizosphaerae]
MTTVDTAPASGRRVRLAPLQPRTLSLAVAAALVIALTALAALLPVPYVILTPGPTANTLGVDGRNGDVISISGHASYPASGHLQLLTVSLYGGPGRSVDLLQALRAWFDRADAVLPERSLFADKSEKQVKQEDDQEMQLSQSTAVTAALNQLRIPIGRRLVIQAVAGDAPAKGVLEPGDQIVQVDGKAVSTPDQVRAGIQAHAPGQTVAVQVLRAGKTLDLTVPTRDASGKAQVGITPALDAVYPFRVSIRLQDVGGPSAGMMFTLGIIDKLTPGDLTGGAFVAGTGTIDDAGDVGAIGGIQQKLVAARRAGATFFLAPAANCGETKGAVPSGLQVIKVAKLQDSLNALQAIREHRTASLPSCS